MVRAGCLLLVLLAARPAGAQPPCACPPVLAPCPPPTATLDLTALCLRLDALDAQLTALQAQAKVQAEKKPLVVTLLQNRYVDMLLAAAVAVVTVRVMR
jgi:hypothetical protein